MKRDWRLLMPIALLLISLATLAYQTIVVTNYIHSSVLDPNWETFVYLYGVEAPANGPDQFCFDYCAPDLPFVAGWIGIGCFLSALLSLIYIWFRPKV